MATCAFMTVLGIFLFVKGTFGQNYFQLYYNVTEERNPGWEVGNLLQDTHIDQYERDESVELSFGYLESGAPYQEYFVIETTTGMLMNVQRLDREELCPSQTLVCQLELNIRTEPHEHVHNIKVIITVEDINDNSPSFDDRNVAISVSESTSIGASFVLPTVKDVDAGKNGILMAQLDPEEGHPFKLEGAMNPDNTMDLRLVLQEDLDRETTASFTLTVIVSDGGSPTRSGRLNVDITVIDANDNPPRFTNSTYDVTTDENIPIGTTIFQVQAIDPDEGNNGAVTFDFVRSTAIAYGDMFGINKYSGDIYTKAELDRESSEMYRLSVLAEDGGISAQTAFTKVNIHIRDENDNAPSIKISALNGAHANIPEDASPGSYVAHIVVSDEDKGKNGEFMCQMTSEQFELVYLFGNEYKIVTRGTFDRENVTNYSVTLKCDDFGQPSKSTKIEIPVFVTDINDHNPVFVSESYHLNLNENNPVHSSLFQVAAEDKDIGVNAELTYAIQYLPINGSVNLGDLLSINAETGTIFANIPFDHENGSFYAFNITATDHGEEPRTASAILTVSIIDTNDEEPQFNITNKDKKYKFGTFENQPVGTEIGTVKAYDRDSPPYNEVSYMLDVNHSDLSTFQIDENSGKITTKRFLDRETKSEYNFKVIAYNKGTLLMSSVNVTLQIADKNDNSPFIMFPHAANDTVKVMGNAKKNERVTKVVAFDHDVGENAELLYKIVYRNDDNLFDIDPLTGEVILARDCDQSFYNKMVELVLLVSDSGEPSLSSTANLYVFINGSFPTTTVDSLAAEEGSDVAVIIICILVLVIVVIIIVLFVLFMLRRKRINRQRQQRLQQKYQGHTDHPSSKTNALQLNTSGNSVKTDATDLTDSSHNQSGYRPSGDGYGHGQDLSFIKQSEESQQQMPQSYQPIYVQNLPAHSAAMVKYSPDSSTDDNDKVHNPVSGYSHLGEVQLQVHDLLHNLDADHADLDSSSSVTDSGKGSSEGDIIHRASPLSHIEGVKKYNLQHQLSVPENNHHRYSMDPSSSDSGPLARSSGRPLKQPPFITNPANAQGFNRQASPILKGCIQDKNRSDSDTPGKKKSVHFGKPFAKQNDLSGISPKALQGRGVRPATQLAYVEGQFPHHIDSRMDRLNSSEDYDMPRQCVKNGNKLPSDYHSTSFHPPTNSSGGIHSNNNNRTNSPYMDMRGVPLRDKHLIGQRRDSLSDCEGDSQGAYSDGDTTTSGSYCMDDEDVIGPDVYV